jgi:cysteinyl-tRNA synthetase
VLGVDLDATTGQTADGRAAEPFITLLIAIRADLRAAKQWALADRIRDGLAERGVVLEDGPAGTSYRFE